MSTGKVRSGVKVYKFVSDPERKAKLGVIAGPCQIRHTWMAIYIANIVTGKKNNNLLATFHRY